jgi:hypothetical protein
MGRGHASARVLSLLLLVAALAGCGRPAVATPAQPTTGVVQRGSVTKQLILEGAMGGGNGAVVAAQDTVWTGLAVGQPARLLVDVIPDANLAARVETISPYVTIINQQRGYHYVNIEILDPVDPRLAPSQRVRAIITTVDVPNVLTVPNSAVTTEGGQHYVNTADGRRLAFTAGAVGDKVTEVRGGLEAGQVVRLP